MMPILTYFGGENIDLDATFCTIFSWKYKILNTKAQNTKRTDLVLWSKDPTPYPKMPERIGLLKKGQNHCILLP